MRSLRTSSDKDSDKSIIELLRQAMQTSIIEQSDKFTSGLSIGTAASPSVNYSTTYKANSPVNTIAIPPVNTTATIITPRADLNKPVQASSYTTAPHNEPAFTAWLRPVFAEANMKKLYDEKILNLHYGERVVYHNKLAAAQKTRDMLRGEKPDEMPECIKIRIMILNTETTEEDSIYIKKYALALPMIRIIQARLQFAKYDVAKVKFIELLYNHIQLFDVALSIKNSISIIDNKTKEKLFTIDCDIHTATYICMLNNRLLDLISEVEEKYDVKVD